MKAMPKPAVTAPREIGWTMNRLWMLVAVCFALIGFAESASTQANQAAGRPTVWPPRLVAPAQGEVEVLPCRQGARDHRRGRQYHSAFGRRWGVDGGHRAGRDDPEGARGAEDHIKQAAEDCIVNTTRVRRVSAVAIAARARSFLSALPTTAGPQVRWTSRARRSSRMLLHRVAGTAGHPALEDGWPDNTYSIAQKRLYFNDEPVVITHVPSNTDSNSVVLFRKSDVVSAGGLLDLTTYPVIDVAGAASRRSLTASTA